MRALRFAFFALILSLPGLTPQTAEAQPEHLLMEGQAGGAWFIDESFIDHFAIGGGVRRFVTPSVAIGPEVTFMRGPGVDRDWSVTGNVSFDLRQRLEQFTPYVIAGGGITRSRLAVGTGAFTSSEGAVFGGVGVRIVAGGRWFVAPEFRWGWEPLWRFGVSIGLR